MGVENPNLIEMKTDGGTKDLPRDVRGLKEGDVTLMINGESALQYINKMKSLGIKDAATGSAITTLLLELQAKLTSNPNYAMIRTEVDRINEDALSENTMRQERLIGRLGLKSIPDYIPATPEPRIDITANASATPPLDTRNLAQRTFGNTGAGRIITNGKLNWDGK